jgi:hypothetical protein
MEGITKETSQQRQETKGDDVNANTALSCLSDNKGCVHATKILPSSRFRLTLESEILNKL